MLTLHASRGLQAVGFLRCVGLKARLESLTHFSSSNVSYSKERIGPNGIQMLSKFLHEQIFGGTDNVQWNPISVEKSQQELSQHGLSDKKVPLLEDVQLQLPTLYGNNIDEHFNQIASHQLEPYMKLINKMLGAKLPPTPSEWSMSEGWTRYERDGKQTHVVSPAEECLVLDVEVCIQEGCAPTLAVAASPTHWYSWVSKRLASGEDDYLHKSGSVSDELISLGGFPEKAGLVIGHNVSYDRARVKEQYNIKNSNVRFLDTLSLHTCVAGQTADQKLSWKRRFGKEPWEQEIDNTWKQNWYNVSSLGDLLSTYWLHCGGKMDKSTRDMFVTENMSVIRDHFQELMQYCCDDVQCTQKLFCAVFPQFQNHCPHPVTLAGMLEMGTAYLPVNEQWNKYVHNCEWVYEDVMDEMKKKLITLANNAITYQHDDRYKKDIWLANLDWSVKNFRGKMTKKQMKQVMEKINNQSENDCDKEEFEFIISNNAPLAKRAVHMPGYPNWYRKLCLKPNDEEYEPGPVLLTAQTRISPYLLKMTWNGYPLYYHSTKGWGYLVMKGVKSKSETIKTNKEIDADFYFDRLSDHVDEGRSKYDEQETSSGPSHPPDDEIVLESTGQKALFYRLPHKDGPLNNVGNPLSLNFLNKMDDGTLYSQAGEEGRRILMLNSMISFWRSSRDRIRDQYVVWTDSDQTLHRVGCILPQLITAGTVTRRGVESTWLTASNPKENRVGSELKSLVQAPDGYQLVGADVDSQELWIASVIGDAHFAGIHGSTPVGWMTLQGKKSEGTDLHSKTASTIGITRDQAKVFNYGRIYGAGNQFAIQLLKQFNSTLSKEEAEEKASVLYAATKGTRRYVLSKRGIQLAKDYDIKVATDSSIDWKQYRKLRDLFLQDSSNSNYKYMPRIIKQSYWSNGSESHMFNKLEEIAASPDPSTPVLNCKISRALKPQYVGTQYMTSRVNWVVQSSAVDYLHLILVCMRWLIECYQIDARFCISIHDEVRYLVRSEDCYRAALALQITNVLTRSMFAYKLGMNDLPQSVAFFSAVDIDKVLRKEVTMDCRTPSNPLGLAKSQGIAQGETVDIYQVMEITKGSLEKNG